ncbi:MAG: acetyl-CoA C-acetyltransferase, partial [Candidatus Latescibacteria bacterium]|nr:acetyl-CoA C-acetyltransferase [Candidatus Latescibacterota bacterium]
MYEAVVVSACRTPIGTFGGKLKDTPAAQLAAVTIQEALLRVNVSPDEVDEVIFGNVLQAGTGQNIARQAAVHAGIPLHTPAFTVNKVCGSGMKAVALAAQAIQAGQGEVFVAGGTESMSRAPYLLDDIRWNVRMGHRQLVDSMIWDGLWCSFEDCHMGVTAENLARRYGISREEQDRFAARSQQRAEAAIREGRFREEIVPVEVHAGKSDVSIVDTDEHPRFGMTEATLCTLRPAFQPDGTVTAGNASGLNDGAACLAVMERSRAEAAGVEPLASIRTYASVGVDPALMGMGPVPAIHKALTAAGLHLDDIDLIEINEAFAVQTLAVLQELSLDESRVNVKGGAIALGHPIGCSGARILVTLLHALREERLRKGLAALCIGGGQG